MISGEIKGYVHPCKGIHRNNLVMRYQRLKRQLETEIDHKKRKALFCDAEDVSKEIDRLDDEFIASLPLSSKDVLKQ